ncbi:MAG: hypothetical protein ABWX70_09525 [Hyphomicrobium sp.]
MTYEDPQSGRDRNLGQDDVGSSSGSVVLGIVFLAAVVFGGWYFYNNSHKVADATQPTTTSNTADGSGSTMSPQSSGPGVQGETGGKNGPAAQPNNSSSTGTSSGNTGVGGDTSNTNSATVPSQDSTGVKGADGSKNGPSPNPPAPTNP